MRKIHILLAAMLIYPITAASQGAGPTSYPGAVPARWQLGIGYQYNRINLTGTPFNTQGENTTITQYFSRWFGVDGQVGIGFSGNTRATTVPPNLGVHSFFVGGGPRLAYRGPSRFQPWLHFVIGLQEFRFTQTAGVLGSNHGLGGAAGGGTDFTLTPHFSFRVEADALGTHLFSAYQRHFQIVSGLVFNF